MLSGFYLYRKTSAGCITYNCNSYAIRLKKKHLYNTLIKHLFFTRLGTNNVPVMP